MEFDVRFKHPYAAIVAAPSQSGKTVFVQKWLQNVAQMTTVIPTRILYYYGAWQDLFNHFPAYVTFREGLPDVEELKAYEGPQMVVLDDMMAECSKSPSLNAMFTKYVHHHSISVVFLVQNLFYNNTKTARVNTNYLVLFKSPADKLQIAALGRQLYPHKSKRFMQVYDEVTEEPYSYLLIDLHPTTSEALRLRCKIFPDDGYQIVYKV